ncbi:MAG: hypothetical protein AAGC73_04785 [Verrucomicrobiota bacterium]
MKSLIATTTLTTLLTLNVSAQAVTFGFDNNRGNFGAVGYTISGTGTSFQDADELETATFTVSGGSLSNPFSFTMTADDTASTGDTLEIDGTGLDVDGAGIDTTELITFTFTTDILLTDFDFADIDDSTFAAVTIAGSLQTFGSNGTDSHAVNLALDAGQELVFLYAATDGINYDLQSLSFNVVPEPGAFALIGGIFAFGFVALRRRNLK